MRKRGRNTRIICAAVMSVLMTLQTGIAPLTGSSGLLTAWADPAGDALGTAILLLRTDLDGNRTTIGVLIDNAIAAADPASPAVQMLQNAKQLLDGGSGDVSAMEAYLQAAQGLPVRVVKLGRVKPIDPAAVEAVLACKNVFFFEEGVRSGGIGEAFALQLLERGFKGNYSLTAVPDCFVAQASVDAQLRQYGLDAQSIRLRITNEEAHHAG